MRLVHLLFGATCIVLVMAIHEVVNDNGFSLGDVRSTRASRELVAGPFQSEPKSRPVPPAPE